MESYKRSNESNQFISKRTFYSLMFVNVVIIFLGGFLLYQHFENRLQQQQSELEFARTQDILIMDKINEVLIQIIPRLGENMETIQNLEQQVNSSLKTVKTNILDSTRDHRIELKGWIGKGLEDLNDRIDNECRLEAKPEVLAQAIKQCSNAGATFPITHITHRVSLLIILISIHNFLK